MNLFLKPAAAADGTPLLVRDPFSRQPLAAAGEWKPRTSFWLRRLAQGDVCEAELPCAGAAPTLD